jgi:hypothetical protein
VQTIFLEFKHENGAIAANGTDVIFYIDGRWKWSTTEQKIYERVSALRSGPFGVKYSKQEFVGFTYSQQPYSNRSGGAIRSMKDRVPPTWRLTAHAVVNPWSGENVKCKKCLGIEFFSRGRSLDYNNWQCAKCGENMSTMTETGMSR